MTCYATFVNAGPTPDDIRARLRKLQKAGKAGAWEIDKAGDLRHGVPMADRYGENVSSWIKLETLTDGRLRAKALPQSDMTEDDKWTAESMVMSEFVQLVLCHLDDLGPMRVRRG